MARAICEELKKHFEKIATPGKVGGHEVTYVHGYCTRQQLFEYFIAQEIEVDGHILAPTYDYFITIWRDNFPWTWLAGETTCPTCYDLKSILVTAPVDSYGNAY